MSNKPYERDYPIPEYNPSLSDEDRARIAAEADAELKRIHDEWLKEKSK